MEKSIDQIIALIAQHPAITTSMLAKFAGLTRRGVEHNIKKLKEEGRIERIGPDKGGKWKIESSAN